MLSKSVSLAFVLQASAVVGSFLSREQETYLKDTTVVLPEVSEVLSKPNLVFEALSSRVSKIAKHLQALKQESEASINMTRRKFGTKLEALRAENSATKLFNVNLSKKIDELTLSNKNLRSGATALMQANLRVESDLQALQNNISTAQEFVQLALTTSDELLHKAPELHVLQELLQNDLNAQQSQVRESRLNEISAHGAPLVSLLQTSSQHDSDDSQPASLLLSMTSALADLQKEQNASETSLQDAFEKDFQGGQDRHRALLEEQAALNATFVEASDLNTRLTAAVSHLERVHQELLTKRDHLRSFVQHLGVAALPAKVQQPSEQVGIAKPETDAHEQLPAKTVALRSVEQRLAPPAMPTSK